MTTEPVAPPENQRTRGITHIAGTLITIDGHYVRQRCAWCPTILIDYDLARMAFLADDPMPGVPSTWPEGKLVQVDANVSWVVERQDGDPLPVNACARIDPSLVRDGYGDN